MGDIIISFLTSVADHVRIVERRLDAGNALANPARPTGDVNDAAVITAQV